MKLELSSLKFETAMPAVATFLLVALFDCRSLAKGICVSLSLLIFRLLPRRLTIRMSAFFFSNLPAAAVLSGCHARRASSDMLTTPSRGGPGRSSRAH